MSQIRKLAPLIISQILKSKNILLTLHPSPDGDSIGSSLGLFHYLQSINKNVTLISGDDIPKDTYSFLPGFNDITLKTIHEIDLSKYDLLILPDISKLDRVTTNLSFVIPPNLNVINIDHHPDNDINCDISLVLPDYTSASEIISTILRLTNQNISKQSASCFFVGIFSDTGGFLNLNTTPHSIKEAGRLVKINPDSLKYIRQHNFSRKPQELEFIKLALNCTKTYFNDSVAICTISNSDLTKSSLDTDFINKSYFSDFLKTVSKWKICICMVEEEPGITIASCRTMYPEFDMSLLASQVGRGGGHKVAAGTQIDLPAEKSLDKLLEQIKVNYPQLNNLLH